MGLGFALPGATRCPRARSSSASTSLPNVMGKEKAGAGRGRGGVSGFIIFTLLLLAPHPQAGPRERESRKDTLPGLRQLILKQTPKGISFINILDRMKR